MKKIRVTFIKVPKIQMKNQLTELAEQIIQYEGPEITIKVPDNYAILTVTEFLPDVIIKDAQQLTIKN